MDDAIVLTTNNNKPFPPRHREYFPKHPIGPCQVICPARQNPGRERSRATSSLSNKKQGAACPPAQGSRAGHLEAYSGGPVATIGSRNEKRISMHRTTFCIVSTAVQLLSSKPWVVGSAVACLCIAHEHAVIKPAKPKTVTF